MITTTNMGLVAWDQEPDFYSHSDLANNFLKVDVHDHTSTKGLQIPSGGLQDGAITSAKLASAAVTTTAVADNAITNAKLATLPKPLFLGAVVPFFRATSAVAYPDDQSGLWRLADGTLLQPAEHDFGGGVFRLPDWRNRFLLGAMKSGGGETPNVAPGPGQMGGAHTVDLSHQHHLDGRIFHRHFDDDRDFDDLGDILCRNRDFIGWPWGFAWWGRSVSLLTDVQGSTAQDIRPQYVGLLFYIQVKNA